jgi:hypothetical protein
MERVGLYIVVSINTVYSKFVITLVSIVLFRVRFR